jgi:glucose/arabinose dehydrogenase
VHKSRDTDGDGKADEIVDVLTDLPSGGHWWRPIYVVDDGFFTGIGDSGNITDQPNTDRQKIWKYSLDGKTRVLWSSGLRNTEKVRYRPGTKELYGCDQGSDWFGQPLGDKEGNQPITDWNPPEEMNLLVQDGFYGHPYLFGNRTPRVEYQNRPDIIELANKTIPPQYTFGAHWAADGWTFLTKDKLGNGFTGDALIGFHGSWNRKQKAGYRVEHVLFDKVTGRPFGSQMLVGTLGEDGQVLARPVDVVEEPDGNVLFSDDQGNRIFRIAKS